MWCWVGRYDMLLQYWQWTPLATWLSLRFIWLLPLCFSVLGDVVKVAPVSTLWLVAMVTPTQGSATVGIKSKTHVVLAALKRSTSELSAYQRKIYPVDDHVGCSIAGLTADGRLLWWAEASKACCHGRTWYRISGILTLFLIWHCIQLWN